MTKAGTRTFGYDMNGNMTAMTDSSNSLTRSLLWDEENRLKKTTDTSTSLSASTSGTNSIVTTYEYDAAGMRALKKGKYGTVQYVNENYVVRNKDLISKHVFAGNTRLVSNMVMREEKSGKMVSTEQGCYYYHADHLGSSSVVTDKNGKFYEQLEYFPYGETWVHNKATSDDSAQSTPYKFTGKEQDPETGLYYYGARYYDAKLSRWVSADDRFDDLYSAQGQDIFGYVKGNPVKYNDPTGHYSEDSKYQNYGFGLDHRVSKEQKNNESGKTSGGGEPNTGSQNGGNASAGGSKGGWSSPIKGFDAKNGNGLSSDFGERNIVPKLHKGIDIAASNGTPIYAAHDGKISYGVDNYIDENGDKRGYGNYAVIKATNGIFSRYGHMNDNSISFLPDGSNVIAGKTIIGYVGNTGNSKGNHLHFEVFYKGFDQNPYPNVPNIPVGDKIFYNPRRFLEDME